MRMYPKKLQSVQDLELEKARLQKRLRKLDEQELFSMASLTGQKKDSGKDSEGFGLNTLMDILPVKNPLVGMIADFAKDAITERIFKTGKHKEAEEPVSNKKTNKGTNKAGKIAGKVAKEFIGGYLKWKAIELSYKGIKYLVKSKRKSAE